MNLKERAGAIPELRGEDFHIAPLRGGVSNRSYLISGDFGRWVLRINAEVDGVDRQRENEVLDAIADEPWAPRVIRNAHGEGYLLYEFVAAPVWTASRAREPEGQRAVGTWLRGVHAKPATAVPPVDAVGALRGYLERLPPAHAEPLGRQAEPVIRRWNAGRARWSEALCHLDLVATNVLGNGRVESVIDWEFGGRAEPALDLAFYLHYHELDGVSGAPLLDGYGASDALRERVAVALELAALLDRAWCLRLEQHHARSS